MAQYYYMNKKTGELLNKKDALTYWCNEYDGNDPDADIAFDEVFEKTNIAITNLKIINE